MWFFLALGCAWFSTFTITSGSSIWGSRDVSTGSNSTYHYPSTSSTPPSTQSSATITTSSTIGIGEYIRSGLGIGGETSSSTASNPSTASGVYVSSGPGKALFNTSTDFATAPGLVTATSSTNSRHWSVPATGNGTSYAAACDGEWFSYAELLKYGNSTSTILSTTVSGVTAYTATITTLCDGHSRVLGTLTPLSSWLTPRGIENAAPYSGPAPSCSINQADCVSMQSSYASASRSYESALKSWRSAGSPTDTYPSAGGGFPPACTIIGSVQPSYCGACTIIGGTVQLMYFPVTTDYTRNMCATTPSAPTACPFGETVSGIGTDRDGATWAPCAYLPANATKTTNSGPYLISDGMTFYQNRAYLSYATAYATNTCGPVGGAYSGGFLELASSNVYSVTGYNYELFASAWSFNFADLIDPVPASAYLAMPRCGDSNNDYGTLNLEYPNTVNNKTIGGICPIIVDQAYAPVLAVPPDFRELDPKWSSCLLGLDGLWDPPKALEGVITEASPTEPTHSSIPTTSASPVQLASPTTMPTTTSSSDPSINVANESAGSNGQMSSSTAQPASSAVHTTAGNGGSGGESGIEYGGETSTTVRGNPVSSVTSRDTEGSGSNDPGSAGSPSTVGSSGSSGSLGSNGRLGPIVSPESSSNSSGTITSSSSNDGSRNRLNYATSPNSRNPGSPSSDRGSSGDDLGSESTIFTVDSSSFTVIQAHFGSSSDIVIANGGTMVTLKPGSATMVGGQPVEINNTPVSVGSGMMVVGGSNGQIASTIAISVSTGSDGNVATVSFEGVAATISSGDIMIDGITIVDDAQTISGAVSDASAFGNVDTTIVISGQTLTASADVSNPTVVSVDGIPVRVDASAQTIGGIPISLASSGLVLGGSIVAIPTPTALVTFTESNGDVASVEEVSGATVIVAGSSTITVGGDGAATINGETVSVESIAGSSDLVVGGTKTVPFTPTASTASAEEAVVTLSGHIFTATEPTGASYVVIGGTTLSPGGSEVTIDGAVISDGPNGLVIGGTKTVALTTTEATSTSATSSTLGGSTPINIAGVTASNADAFSLSRTMRNITVFLLMAMCLALCI